MAKSRLPSARCCSRSTSARASLASCVCRWASSLGRLLVSGCRGRLFGGKGTGECRLFFRCQTRIAPGQIAESDSRDTGSDRHGHQDQRSHRNDGQRGLVPPGEFAASGTPPTAGRPAPARRSGSAACRRRGRWPSRSGGCGPSPAPSSRSSRARRGPASLSFAGSMLPVGGDRRQRLAACSAACSAWAAPPRG